MWLSEIGWIEADHAHCKAHQNREASCDDADDRFESKDSEGARRGTQEEEIGDCLRVRAARRNDAKPDTFF